MPSPEPVPALWRAAGIGVWAAADGPDHLGTIEETTTYGFVVKDRHGEWLASFSMFSDAMWFVDAQRT